MALQNVRTVLVLRDVNNTYYCVLPRIFFSPPHKQEWPTIHSLQPTIASRVCRPLAPTHEPFLIIIWSRVRSKIAATAAAIMKSSFIVMATWLRPVMSLENTSAHLTEAWFQLRLWLLPYYFPVITSSESVKALHEPSRTFWSCRIYLASRVIFLSISLRGTSRRRKYYSRWL